MDRTHYLSKEEVRYFSSRSDWLAWRTLVVTWLGLLGIFWVVDTWPHVVTIVAAIMLLGGRQLGLAVITHECGHNSFFRQRRLNQFAGQYLAANFVFLNMYGYSREHTQHHQLVGMQDDPDLSNYQAYPIDSASFKRKVIRDLSGQTGYKLIRYVLSNASKIFSRDPEARAAAQPFVQQLLVNLLLALVLSWLFSPWSYLLWLAAIMTTYTLVLRIRQVAEHAATPDLCDKDPRKSTRTTIPAWWERPFFAPNYVNYHLEHHFLPGVPCYRLRALHELLKLRGAYRHTEIFRGYTTVLRHAVS